MGQPNRFPAVVCLSHDLLPGLFIQQVPYIPAEVALVLGQDDFRETCWFQISCFFRREGTLG